VANGIAQQTPAAATQPGTPPVVKESTKTPAKPAETSAFKSRKEKFSYALGMNIGNGLGQNLKKQSVDFDPSLVANGLKDSLSGGKTLMTVEEAQVVLKEVQVEMQKEQQEKMKEAAERNRSSGDAFLAANKDKEGVVTLPSGLQYKILTEGTGPKPTADDSVVCNYRGTLVDGKEFDSSYKRGQPATFPVKGVIKGWTEALQLMPVGSKWELFVPPGLAYGEQGVGADIGPNSTLIFEVDLVSIKERDQDKKEMRPSELKPDDQKPDQQE